MWTCAKCQSEVEDDYFGCWNCSEPKPDIGGGVTWFSPKDNDPVLLLIPESLITLWHGAGPGYGDVPAQDLERALAVRTWIEPIVVGSGQALVLAGYPTNAAFLNRTGTLYVLRWLFAYGEEDLLALVQSDLPTATIEAPVTFDHPGGRLCLIGVGEYGPELGYEPATSELAAGRYLVSTFTMKKPRTEVLVHRFDHAP